jgi:hypothetical protein
LVSQVESCFTDTQNYATCQTTAQLDNTGLPLVDCPPAPPQGNVGVCAVGPSPNQYTITATSRSGNTFSIIKDANGVSSRQCQVPVGGNKGGCANGTPGGAAVGW